LAEGQPELAGVGEPRETSNPGFTALGRGEPRVRCRGPGRCGWRPAGGRRL